MVLDPVDCQRLAVRGVKEAMVEAEIPTSANMGDV